MLQREAAPLRARALKLIRSKIVNNVYPPGSRIKEKNLCEELNVSRSVVREVLRQLETERLVLVMPNVGPVVAALTLSDVRDLYGVRSALEATAGQLAAREASPAQIDTLEEIYAAIAAGGSMPVQDLIQLKDGFYRALIDASGNKVIGETLDNVQARISQLRRLTLSHPDRHPQMIHELGCVLDAIKARDPEAAYKACVLHVESAQALAQTHFAADRSEVP